MRRYPMLSALALVILLVSAWVFFHESEQASKYDAELSFDLVRVVSALHHVHRITGVTPAATMADPALRAQWDQIRFVLSRWEAEQDKHRRQLIKLMKRAIRREASFDERYMQQYSGRIVLSDVGPGEDDYPLYTAARLLMQEDVLGLSAQERSQVAAFAAAVFADEAQQIREIRPSALAEGRAETLVAARVLQDAAP